jgi:hypothetical protein
MLLFTCHTDRPESTASESCAGSVHIVSNDTMNGERVEVLRLPVGPQHPEVGHLEAFMGEHDPALGERQIIEAKNYVTGPWRYVGLPDVGDFFPVTAAERVNELLTEFFA